MDDNVPDLPWTGERYVPQLGGAIKVEHLHRYALACELGKGKRVLDIASGEGYGSEMLSKTAKSVVGIDIDTPSIAHAQSKYKRTNLSFIRGSCTQIPLQDSSVDVVASFETIEHIEDHEKMLAEIKRVLTAEGILIISSPEKHEYTEVPDHHNYFHVKELYSNEFKELLEKFFKHHKMLGQRITYGSSILEVGKTSSFGGTYDINDLPNNINKNVGLSRPLYLIAICSDEQLPQIESSLCEQPLWESDSWKQWAQQVSERDEQIAKKEQQIAKKEQQIAKKDAQMIEKDAQIEQKNAQLVEKEAAIAKRDIQIERNKAQHIKKDAQIEQKNAQLVEKEAAIARRDIQIEQNKAQHIKKDLLIAEKNLQLKLKNAQMIEKDAQMIEKDAQMIEKDAQIIEKDARIIENTFNIIEIEKNKIIQWMLKVARFNFKKRMQTYRMAYEIARSDLFDRDWYLQQYPDVKEAGYHPVFHYITFGAKEGRDPNALFHSKWYLGTNPDVAQAGINPLYHYIKFGWKEGRAPNLFFNLKWYLEQHPKLADSGVEPLAHYIANGGDWALLTKNKEKKSESLLADIIANKHGLKVSQDILELLVMLEQSDNKSSEKESDHRDQGIDLLKEKVSKTLASTLANNKECEVTIIIPVHNQLAYTLACVISILQSKINCSYEILIGDDASTDGTRKIFSNIHSLIKHVYHAENLGFLKNCNETAKYARGKYLIFLNNDTLVLPGWADALVDIFHSRSDAGLVGAKLLNANGTLQEAGGIVWNDGSAWNYGRGDDESKPGYNYVRECDYCSGACIMIPKTLWNELKGFDEIYSPAYYEDTDLAFKVRQIGKKVYYQPAAELIHCEGISNGRDISQGVKEYQQINHKKFFKRWESELQSNHYPNGTSLFTARMRSTNCRTILFIDHYIPTPEKDAGSKSITSYIAFFIRNGFNVLLIGDNYVENKKDADKFRQMGVEVLIGSGFQYNSEQWFIENGQYIDYAFLCRPHTSLRWIEPLRKHTKAKLLFYGVDLISRTRERAYLDTGLKEHQKISQEFRKHEDAIHPLVDMIFYPSQEEVDYLSTSMGYNNVRKIPLYVYNDDLGSSNYNSKMRHGLLFVGGFQHTPNLDGIIWFLTCSFPKILKEMPGMTLTIVGSDAPAELLAFSSNAIKIKTNISDEELSDLIKKARLSIAPLRFGGGVKGKIVDAMRHGLPVITTEIGAEGLDAQSKNMVVASLANFSNKIIELYNNDTLLNEISATAIKYVAANFSQSAMKQSVADLNF